MDTWNAVYPHNGVSVSDRKEWGRRSSFHTPSFPVKPTPPLIFSQSKSLIVHLDHSGSRTYALIAKIANKVGSSFRTCLFQNTNFFLHFWIQSLHMTPRPRAYHYQITSINHYHFSPRAFRWASCICICLPTITGEPWPSEMCTQAFPSCIHDHQLSNDAHLTRDHIPTYKVPHHLSSLAKLYIHGTPYFPNSLSGIAMCCSLWLSPQNCPWLKEPSHLEMAGRLIPPLVGQRLA